MWGRRAAPAVSCPSDDDDRAHGVRAPHSSFERPAPAHRIRTPDVGPARRASGSFPSLHAGGAAVE